MCIRDRLSKKLARLYGASLSVDGVVNSGSRVLTVAVGGIKDEFALNGEKLSEEYAALADVYKRQEGEHAMIALHS